MLQRTVAALIFALRASSSLSALPPAHSLCIVQTKPDHATEYDPSAGPWAIELNGHLSGQKLRNGVPLNVVVLAASVQKDVLPEIIRLQCAWGVQLWYTAGPRSIFFSLLDATTGKSVASGIAPIRSNAPWVTALHDARDARAIACAGLAQQILDRLNQLHTSSP